MTLRYLLVHCGACDEDMEIHIMSVRITVYTNAPELSKYRFQCKNCHAVNNVRPCVEHLSEMLEFGVPSITIHIPEEAFEIMDLTCPVVQAVQPPLDIEDFARFVRELNTLETLEGTGIDA